MRRTRAQPTTLRPATGRPRGLNPLRILLTLLTEGKPRGLNLPLKRMPVWCTQMMPGPQDLSYHASRREENLAMGFRSAHAPAYKQNGYFGYRFARPHSGEWRPFPWRTRRGHVAGEC